jgi:hypothetical protein
MCDVDAEFDALLNDDGMVSAAAHCMPAQGGSAAATCCWVMQLQPTPSHAQGQHLGNSMQLVGGLASQWQGASPSAHCCKHTADQCLQFPATTVLLCDSGPTG